MRSGWRLLLAAIYGAVLLLLFFISRFGSAPGLKLDPLREKAKLQAPRTNDQPGKTGEVTVSLKPITVLQPEKKDIKRLSQKQMSSSEGALSQMEVNGAGDDRDTTDEFPPMVAHYESIGFTTYLRQIVKQAGARVFIGDTQKHRLLAELLPLSEETKPVTCLQGLAVGRPRIISDAGADAFLKQARKQFGSGSYDMVLYFPEAVETSIVNKIAAHIGKKGIAPSSLAHLEGHYRLLVDDLLLQVTAAVTKSGESVPLNVPIVFKEHLGRRDEKCG